MNKKIKNVLIILLLAIAIYLLISGIYTLVLIDFNEQYNRTFGLGYSEATNYLRIFMGVPPTHSTYEGIPPTYLAPAIIKIVAGIILLPTSIFFLLKTKSQQNSR